MRDSGHYSSLKCRKVALLAFCALVLSVPVAFAKADKKPVVPLVEQSAVPSDEPVDSSDSSPATASSMPPLQGSTEVMELIIEEQPLYKEAKASIEKEDYNRAIGYLQELIPKLGEGYEPYRAECLYNEAGCHLMLKRMNAATDTYRKAFELFEKFDTTNPLKGKAWNQYFSLKHQKGSLDQQKLEGGVEQQKLEGMVDQRNVTLLPQKALIAIDPNAMLAVRENNRDIPILSVNDKTVLPKIVKECFSEMSCLETAEIGSNSTNADARWMPVMVQGHSAAFALDGHANPTFRANVNGRSYLFDVILPEMGEGTRKILLVTNREKICAVDVDTFDTWLLRMGRAKDGRITTARWFKLTHKKTAAPVQTQAAGTQLRLPGNKRNW
ncbi:MAG: tetratricopeptide repeat protein [Candidatus Melainabacteria bacterium]|nr:tetratricopeptide repeat protein [Candidatus Melainabacteria bacterium]